MFFIFKQQTTQNEPKDCKMCSWYIHVDNVNHSSESITVLQYDNYRERDLTVGKIFKAPPVSVVKSFTYVPCKVQTFLAAA